MTRGARTFRQTDLTRALKAARAAKVEIARIEVDKDGRAVLVIGTPEQRVTTGNELDQWMAKHAHDHEGH